MGGKGAVVDREAGGSGSQGLCLLDGRVPWCI